MIEENHEIVGHVALQRAEDASVLPIWKVATDLEADQMAVVSRLLVSPHVRGRGLGAKLLSFATDRIYELGFQPVLYTGEVEHAAIRMYERSGWTRVGQTTLPLSNGNTLLHYVYVKVRN